MLGRLDYGNAVVEIPERLPLYGRLRSTMAGLTHVPADASEEEWSNFHLYQLLHEMVSPMAPQRVPLNFDISVRRFELLSGEFSGRARPVGYSFR